MSPRWKAFIYVALAAMVPVSETLAVAARQAAWPTEFELAAMLAASLTAALVTLKAWGSDPGQPAPIPPPKDPPP